MFRVREPHAVRHPVTGEYIVPSVTAEYAASEPLVIAYPWLFVAVEGEDTTRVEAATAAPGERRTVNRPRA